MQPWEKYINSVPEIPGVAQQLESQAQQGLQKNVANKAAMSARPDTLPLGVQNFKQWATRGVNALGGIPQAVGAADLFKGMQGTNPMGAYANHMGLQTYNPTQDYL